MPQAERALVLNGGPPDPWIRTMRETYRCSIQKAQSARRFGGKARINFYLVSRSDFD